MFPLIMWLMIKRHCWWSLRSAHTVRVTPCSVLLVFFVCFFYLKFKPAVKLPVSLALTCTCVVVEALLFPGRLLVLEISRTKFGRVTGTVPTPVHREQQRFLLTRFFGFCMQPPEFVSRMGGIIITSERYTVTVTECVYPWSHGKTSCVQTLDNRTSLRNIIMFVRQKHWR